MTDRLSTVIDALDRWANPERATDWSQIPGLPENYYELSLAEKAGLLRDLLAGVPRVPILRPAPFDPEALQDSAPVPDPFRGFAPGRVVIGAL